MKRPRSQPIFDLARRVALRSLVCRVLVLLVIGQPVAHAPLLLKKKVRAGWALTEGKQGKRYVVSHRIPVRYR